MATLESYFSPAFFHFVVAPALQVARLQAQMLALGPSVDCRALLNILEAEADRSASKRNES